MLPDRCHLAIDALSRSLSELLSCTQAKSSMINLMGHINPPFYEDDEIYAVNAAASCVARGFLLCGTDPDWAWLELQFWQSTYPYLADANQRLARDRIFMYATDIKYAQSAVYAVSAACNLASDGVMDPVKLIYHATATNEFLKKHLELLLNQELSVKNEYEKYND